MRVFVLTLVVSLFSGSARAGDKAVNMLRTPERGIQPQAVMDEKGNLHLLYFTGDPKNGDLHYARRAAGQKDFGDSVRVNSQPESAIAVGTIRGGQMALGKSGRVHVVWNGSGKAQPRSAGKYNAPMLYARINDGGTAFEEQRNLMRVSEVLDGGGTVAADRAGNVYVAWHALGSGSAAGEENRKVWLAKSTDEGKTFAEETAVNTKPTGACGCCGMRGFVDSKGAAYFLYRTATDGSQRDMFLLASADRGKSFAGSLLHKWEINACPMSSETFAEGPDGVVAAWDTDGQVYFARIKPGTAAAGKVEAGPGKAQGRKHPAAAFNKKGEMILVWTEGTGWQRGGALAWQVYDRNGQPTSERGRIGNGIGVWGLPAVVAEEDGRFTIIH